MNSIKGFYAVCAAYVIATYTLTQTWPASVLIDVINIASHKEETWWREWIGALSGWVAAAGALAAALLTLPYLKRQAEEAKRQADFALGESLPTFDVYSEGFVEVYLRIVNWNRRTMLLDAIRIVDTEVEVDEIKLSHAGVIPKHNFTIEHLNGAEFYPAIRIAAYDDRSVAPAICTIKIRVYKGVGVVQFTGEFKAEGRLLGENHGDITLDANAIIHTWG